MLAAASKGCPGEPNGGANRGAVPESKPITYLLDAIHFAVGCGSEIELKSRVDSGAAREQRGCRNAWLGKLGRKSVDANRQEVLVEEMKTSDCPSSRSGAVSIRWLRRVLSLV
jgi:hypothetical protein